MERPRIVTGEDAWRAYQCGLLEEIRDLLKGMTSSALPAMTFPEGAKVDAKAIGKAVQIQIEPGNKQTGAKGGGKRGKDV